MALLLLKRCKQEVKPKRCIRKRIILIMKKKKRNSTNEHANYSSSCKLSVNSKISFIRKLNPIITILVGINIFKISFEKGFLK